VNSLEDTIYLANRQWPGLEFKRKTANEASGPCPFCHDGKDRFLLFADHGYWCRQCGTQGWLTNLDPTHRLTREELNDLRLRRVELKQEEHDRRLSALEKIHNCKDHIAYHQQMDADDRAYWHSEGINDASIVRYILGICYRCPTDHLGRPSYTIPVINGGKLVNIRHRLIGAENGDKYRPHMAGLGNTLFNADLVYQPAPRIIITEGEKKAIVLTQNGFPSVGIMGKMAFPPVWAKRFESFPRMYIIMDPDALGRAYETAALFAGRGYVVDLGVKADDLFSKHGGTPASLESAIRWAKHIY